MTYREFIDECVCYPYSKEYFETVKLCSELKLQNIYLKTHEFLTESNQNLTSLVNNGYFCENVNNHDIYESIFTEMTMKSESLFWRIIRRLQKIIAPFWNWLKKIMENIKEKDFYKRFMTMKKKDFDENEYLKQNCLSLYELFKSGTIPFTIRGTEKYIIICDIENEKPEINLTDENVDLDNQIITFLDNRILPFLINKTIKINIPIPYLISISDIESIFSDLNMIIDKIKSEKKVTRKDFIGIRKIINDSNSHVDKNTELILDFSDVNDIKNMMDEFISKKSTAIDLADDSVVLFDGFEEVLQHIGSDIIQLMGNTMLIYSTILNYREKGRNIILAHD